MMLLLKILSVSINLGSAWLIMHTIAYLIEISRNRWQQFLLFAGCYVLDVTIIFIEDPFNILAVTPVFLVIVLFSCRGSFWKKITVGLMFTSTIFSFNALRDNYIPNLLPAVLQQVEHGFPFSRLFSLPFALALYLGTRKFAPDKDYTLSDSMWRLLLLLIITPFGIVLDVITLFRPSAGHLLVQPRQEYAILLLISLLAFISLLWCIIVLARQQKLERQNMFMEINRKYYEAMEQQHFEIRRLKHDLANHIQVLSALPEDKKESYARELAGSTALSQSFACCGDSTVNAVLTVKKSIMERCHIHMETDIEIPRQLPYDKTDICALYANALDNAMEACMKLQETQRKISLKSKAGRGIFCLKINNPVPDNEAVPQRTSESLLAFATAKPDKTNHGFGLKSIQEIVKRYQGHMEIKTEDGIFDLFLYLPLPEQH